MPTSLIALQILMILLPGFAAAYVVQGLATRGTQTDFDKVIESALYSFIIYTVFSIFSRGHLPFEVVTAKPPLTDPTILWDTSQLLVLVGTTAAVALLSVAYINLDGVRVFRKIRLTERTSRRSVWNDIFEGEAAKKQIVQVELDGNRSLLGLITYYSDIAEDCSIFVEQAQWVYQDLSTTKVDGLGVLLTKSANIKSVTLLDPQPEPTAEDSNEIA